MKKISVFLSVLMLGLGCLSGCSEPVPSEPVHVTIWHYYNDEIQNHFNDMVDLFNSTVGAEKGIIVDAYSQGGVNELADAVLAAANKDVGAEEMPNIFAAYPDNAYEMDKLGIVASLDKYFEDSELEEYRKEFLDSGRFGEGNELKIFPVAKSTELMFINNTVFQKFANDTGIDVNQLETWEGLLDIAEQYYDWSEGKAFFGVDSMSNFMIEGMRQQGEEIFTVEDGITKFNFDKEKAKRLWDAYYVPFVKGYYAAEGRFRSDDLKSGKIACFVGSTSSASFFPKEIETGKDTSYPVEAMVMEYPFFDEKFAIEQGAGMVVAKNEENIERACVEFLKWFTDEEQNLKFAVETSYLPVKNQALSHEKAIAILGEDAKDTKYQASKVANEMLIDYELYSTIPFENSNDARKLLNSSLADFAAKDKAEIMANLGNNKLKDITVETYVGEENFDKWYTSLVDEMEKLIK